MHISVVIPLLNEQDSLEELFLRIKTVMHKNSFDYEVIFIDDGSKDDSWKVIQYLADANPTIKAIKFRRNFGKSQALNAAFKTTKGNVVITMDADLQDFPEEIPALYHQLKKEKLDLLSGWKQNRKDPKITKNIPSKLFNWVAKKTSNVDLHDFNCGLKAYDHKLVKQLNLYGDMHRYIPVLAKNMGFTNIGEKKVQHQARKHGTSKFGSSRFINGFLDLITLSFIAKFGNKPMHLFGAIGTLMFLVGFLAAAYLGIEKLYKTYVLNINAKLVTNNPFFYIALTAMVLGTQLFLAGFLGEIIVRNKKDKTQFDIQETINL